MTVYENLQNLGTLLLKAKKIKQKKQFKVLETKFTFNL